MMRYFIEFSVAALVGASVAVLLNYSPINGAINGMCGLLGWYIPDIIKSFKKNKV